MVLADFGAEVLRVDSPAQVAAPPRAGSRMWLRGRNRLTIDLRSPAGRDEARRLCETADVTLQSWRPGVAEALGLDHAALAAANPRLVHCSITGFGPARGLAGVPGYEGVVAARAGLWLGLDEMSGAAITNQAPGRPIFKVVPVNSYSAAQLAVQGIVAALFERERSGLGQGVQTSLLQGALSLVMRMALGRSGEAVLAGPNDPRVHRAISLTFLTAQCADGLWIQMCARQDHHFRNWLRAMDLESVLDEPRFAGAPMGIRTDADIADLEAILRAGMRLRPRDEWMRLFTDDYDVGADPFLHPSEFLDHAQVAANRLAVEVDDPVLGRSRQPAPIAQVRPSPAPAAAPPRHRQPDGDGPLSGVVILEIAYFLAGPLGATLLAEMGARVIKVEPLAGDPFRRTGREFAHLVHGKESIALDLKSPAGRDVVHRLVGRADALIHSFRPGVVERIGLDHPTLQRINPRLVYLYAGSYGPLGPHAHRASFHSTPNALVGSGVVQPGEGNPPVDDSWPDPVAGNAVATALALGLLHRRRSGCGAYIETNMLLSAAHAYSSEVVQFAGRPEPPRIDPGQHGPSASYRLYDTGQGWLFVAAPTPDAWRRLTAVLGRPELDGRFEPPGAPAPDRDLAETVAATFRGRPAAEWEARLTAAGVAAVRADKAEFAHFLRDAGLLTAAGHRDFGSYWKMPAKVGFSRSRSAVGEAASCGEHTVDLLRELGYMEAEIGALLDSGAAAAK